VIEKSDIEKYVTNYILTQGKYSKQNIIIEFNSIPEKIIVKEQNVRLYISEFPNVVLKGNVTLPLDIIANEKIVRRAYVSMKIRTFDSIYVSSRGIRQNDIISQDNIQKKWMETTSKQMQVVWEKG
jgi:hypothetical protein